MSNCKQFRQHGKGLKCRCLPSVSTSALVFSLDPQWRIVVPQCFMKKKRSDIGGGKCRPLISAAQVELQVHCEPDVHRRCQNYSDGTPVYTLHTPLGVKQGAPHQNCLYKCKHIWFLEKCHSRCNWCIVPWSGECWEKWWKGLWSNTKQSSTLPNQTLSPIAALLPSSDPSCLLGQPSLQPCQQIHWQV